MKRLKSVGIDDRVTDDELMVTASESGDQFLAVMHAVGQSDTGVPDGTVRNAVDITA